MAYNMNDPNQQRQPTVDPNQQQLQPANQQATSSPSNPGNYQQNQQNYTWTDGNIQGSHQSTQQSWSWSSQTVTPMPQPLPVQPLPVIPPLPMLIQGTSHHQLHQQTHQNAMAAHSQPAHDIHQQAMNFHQSVHQNMASMMSNITPIVQQTPQPQITYQTISPQPQLLYQQNVFQQPQQQQKPQQAQIAYQPAAPMSPEPQVPPPGNNDQQFQQFQQFQQQQHQVQSPQNIYQQSQAQRQLGFQFPEVQSQQPQILPSQPKTEQRPQPLSNEQLTQSQPPAQRPLQQVPQKDRYEDLEKQRKKYVEDMNRAGHEINKRLRDLEQSKAVAQKDNDAKDREVRHLQEQLASVERQRRQEAERNSQQLADLVRSQATSPVAQTPAFDMSAFQKVIRETQTQQLSAQDIERVIEEQVSKRLSGMATKTDIQDAGAQMQNALSQVPAGLNEQQVQQAVNRELNNVMQDVANRVNQQRRIAGQRQQNPDAGQTPQGHVQTDFVIEELPDEGPPASPHSAGYDTRPQMTLPSAGHHGTASTVAPAAEVNRISHPAPSTNEVPSGPVQRPATSNQPAGRSQYAAIEAGRPQVSNSASSSQAHPAQSSRPQYAAISAPPATPSATMRPGPATQCTVQGASRSNVQMHAAPSRPQPAAIEATPVPLDVPGNAVAVVERSVPATMTARSNALTPPVAMTQQHNKPYAQPSFRTAAPAPTHGQNMPPSGFAPRPIEVTLPQRQLEAAPSSGAQLQIAGAQPVSSPSQGVAHMPPQPRQIEGVASQRQLEGPPSSSAGYPTTGQDLLHQGRDIARQPPRR